MLTSFFLPSLVALAAVASSQSPPCYSTAYPTLETLCTTTISSSGPFSIVSAGVGVDAAVVTSFGSSSNLTAALQDTHDVTAYFEGANLESRVIPATTPLIFRPTGLGEGGGWSASFPLPTSVFPYPLKAPLPNGHLEIELFYGKRLAVYEFVTNALATAEDFTSACARLAAYVKGNNLFPAKGPWAEAWVQFDPLMVKTGRVNQCWQQVL